jgi:pimeloyl-ACP methyl ester carboxylesterase
LRGWRGVFSTAASPELIAEMMSIAVDNSGLIHPGGYRAMAHSMAEADLRDILPQVRVPTLLLYGELDERSPLHIAEYLRAHIPNARLVVIPDAGHMASVAAPAAFNGHVRRFIQSVTQA